MSIGVAAAVVGLGIVVGALSALFGVGGGLLIVPFIVLVLEKSQHVAEGTSLVAIVPTAIVGALMHRRTGFVAFREASLLAAGGILGALIGAPVALAVATEPLQKGFGALLFVMGGRLIWTALRSPAG